jgi:hypothetical protein
MKKRLQFMSVFLIGIFVLSSGVAKAADALPSTSVWFTPPTATAGQPITLNALVYNNQTSQATVTVAFTTPTLNIAAVTATIPAGSAKTISFAWTMPKDVTLMMATVTAATNSSHQSIPSLLGTIGTVTIGTEPTVLANGITFPGSEQISAWFGPFISKVEVWRIQEAAIFTAQRQAVQAKITSSVSQAFSTPMNYIVLIYTTCLASLFSNIAFFYVALILVILLALKFIVNLIF